PDIPAAVLLDAHLSNTAGSQTTVCERISAWQRPQSSVHTTGYVPTRVGVTCSVGWIPGTRSCFWENSGTQKECTTSFDVMWSTIDRSTGSRSTSECFLQFVGSAAFASQP